jgi:hypothetical protein
MEIQSHKKINYAWFLFHKFTWEYARIALLKPMLKKKPRFFSLKDFLKNILK